MPVMSLFIWAREVRWRLRKWRSRGTAELVTGDSGPLPIRTVDTSPAEPAAENQGFGSAAGLVRNMNRNKAEEGDHEISRLAMELGPFARLGLGLGHVATRARGRARRSDAA